MRRVPSGGETRMRRGGEGGIGPSGGGRKEVRDLFEGPRKIAPTAEEARGLEGPSGEEMLRGG